MAMPRASRALLLLAVLQLGPRAAAALSTRGGGRNGHRLDLDQAISVGLEAAMDMDMDMDLAMAAGVDAGGWRIKDSLADSESAPSSRNMGTPPDGDHETRRLSKVNFSPEKRKAAHDYQYVADFWVYLNMTYAMEKELPLGLVLKADEEWIPVNVEKVRKSGLVQMWNDANPDKQVQVNDQIVQINDIVFHANSRTFEQHVVNQFKACRKGLEGAKKTLSLHILRERPTIKNPLGQGARTAYQRLDAHHKQYPKEFTAKLPITEDAASSAWSALGLKLNFYAGHNWEKPWIQSIYPGGLLDKWNEEHPEDMILEGDEITRVDKRNFQHNRKLFTGYIEELYMRALNRSRLNQTEVIMEMDIKRPIYIQDMYDRLPSRDEVNESIEEATATLPMPAATHLPTLFKTASPDDERKNTSGPVWGRTASPDEGPKNTIGRFWGLDETDRKAVDDWNAKNPKNAIKFADQIVGLTEQGGQVNLTLKRKTRKVIAKNRLFSTSRVRANLKIAGLRTRRKMDSSRVFGWRTSFDDRWEPVKVTRLSETGLIAKWNARVPDQAIAVGDYIIAVNGIPWRQDSTHFMEIIENQFLAGAVDNWQEGTIEIVAQKAINGQDSAPMNPTSSPNSDAAPEAPEPAKNNFVDDKAGNKTDDNEGWVGAEED